MRRGVISRALCILVLSFLGIFSSFLPISPVSAQSFFDNLVTGVELMIGESVATNVREEYGEPIELPTRQKEWVYTIFKDLVAQARRREIPYNLTVLNTDVVNAFAAPGGYLFITTGLLKHIGDDTDALANVLGHEVAHVEHRHGMNGLVRRFGIGLLLQLVLGNADNKLWQTVAGVATELMHLGWSREQEHESDELGQQLASAAGYDPAGMVRFFQVIQRLEGEEMPGLQFLRTHPLTSERTNRAQARASALTIAPRTQPKPVLSTRVPSASSSNTDPGTGTTAVTGAIGAANAVRTTPAAGTDPVSLAAVTAGSQAVVQEHVSGRGGRVISRGAAKAPPLGASYHDPAQRFNLQVPAGWDTEPQLYYNLTHFRGPNGENIWVWVQAPEPEDATALAAAQRTLARYRKDYYPDLVVDMQPQPATLSGQPAAYAEYRYSDDEGTFMKEGSYFLLYGGQLYMLQFAEAADRFDGKREVYRMVAQSFATGPVPSGHVNVDTLTAWPKAVVPIEQLFAMEVPKLWPKTWERPTGPEADPDAELEEQLAEFAEIGGNGYIGLYHYAVDGGTTANKTAQDWLDWLKENREAVNVVEPVYARPIDQRPAASFVITWLENGERWVQYGTTIVAGNTSYEIAIIYLESGFTKRRPLFDQMLESWRLVR